MCASGINFTNFYNFLIGFCNCSDRVVFFLVSRFIRICQRSIVYVLGALNNSIKSYLYIFLIVVDQYSTLKCVDYFKNKLTINQFFFCNTFTVKSIFFVSSGKPCLRYIRVLQSLPVTWCYLRCDCITTTWCNYWSIRCLCQNNQIIFVILL